MKKKFKIVPALIFILCAGLCSAQGHMYRSQGVTVNERYSNIDKVECVSDLTHIKYTVYVVFGKSMTVFAVGNSMNSKEFSISVPKEKHVLIKFEGLSGNEYFEIFPWDSRDIIISMETAKRRVEELGADLNTEVIRLFIHGLVHLFGYDHEINEKEARRMRRVERILLTR